MTFSSLNICFGCLSAVLANFFQVVIRIDKTLFMKDANCYHQLGENNTPEDKTRYIHNFPIL